MRNDRIDEPDVTPLINVNLMVLVMSLLISSYAAKLLPLNLPKVGEAPPVGRETVQLGVTPDAYALKTGAGRIALADAQELSQWTAELAELRREYGDTDDKARRKQLLGEIQQFARAGWTLAADPDRLAAAAAALPPGWVVNIDSGGRATPEAVGWAVDCLLKNRSVQVFVDTRDAVPLKVGKDRYDLGDLRGLDEPRLARALDDLPDGLIVLVSMDPAARYERLVRAVDCMMARPSLKVAFGQPGGPVGPTAATSPASGGGG